MPKIGTVKLILAKAKMIQNKHGKYLFCIPQQLGVGRFKTIRIVNRSVYAEREKSVILTLILVPLD